MSTAVQRDYQPVDERVDLEGVEPLIAARWSPRAFLDEAVDPADLALVFEAARLSPSSYNEQPWRFYTSTPSSFDTFLDLLVEGNQRWARSAPVLGFVVASRLFERNGKENPHAVFDSGSAWMAMSLQARALGLYTHGMAGVDFDRVYGALDIDPATHRVICGFAIGRVDPAGDEALTERKPLEALWRAVP